MASESGRSKETPLAGLREQQKQNRQRRILIAAKALFAELGHEKTTIEAIAEAAGVSGVTVHNYYGTKSGVLMAVVADSDRALLEQIETAFSGEPEGLVEMLLQFADIIRTHATTNLDKNIWRQVIAGSISDADSRFGKSYHSLDHQLSLALVREIEKLQATQRVSPEVSAYDLGKALFNLQNTRFIQFIASDDLTSDQVDRELRRDIEALLYALTR